MIFVVSSLMDYFSSLSNFVSMLLPYLMEDFDPRVIIADLTFLF